MMHTKYVSTPYYGAMLSEVNQSIMSLLTYDKTHMLTKYKVGTSKSL